MAKEPTVLQDLNILRSRLWILSSPLRQLVVPRQKPRQITRAKRQFRFKRLSLSLSLYFPPLFLRSLVPIPISFTIPLTTNYLPVLLLLHLPNRKVQTFPPFPQACKTLAVEDGGVDVELRGLEFGLQLFLTGGELSLQVGAVVAVVVALCFVGVALFG
ncbi:hypothetical protein BGZ57DRAFT_308450 [Hyaloscypha finlandica]|nr:hypothetical protein BGZ57DRAFT_308450 [Hyaloscypha finlandica]